MNTQYSNEWTGFFRGILIAILFGVLAYGAFYKHNSNKQKIERNK